MAILEYIDINIDINIDIGKGILENIDKILYWLGFGISNTTTPGTLIFSYTSGMMSTIVWLFAILSPISKSLFSFLACAKLVNGERGKFSKIAPPIQPYVKINFYAFLGLLLNFVQPS